MKKIGMPIQSVINKMRMDGLKQNDIDIFMGKKVNTITKNDPKFKKYRMMEKIGMPIQSIINKMRMDGLKQNDIDIFTGKSSGNNNKKSNKKSDEQIAKENDLIPFSSDLRPKRVPKLKRIHWKVIPVTDIKNTIWYDINHDNVIVKLPAKFELDFQMRNKKPRLHKRNRTKNMLDVSKLKGTNKKRSKIKWINAKRDQAIQIGLRKVNLKNDEIYDGISAMDTAVITVDRFVFLNICVYGRNIQTDCIFICRLVTLLDLVPTVEEQQKAESKIDELGDDIVFVGPSEAFFVELSSLPEVSLQLKKWYFTVIYKEVYTDKFNQVNTIKNAFHELKTSKSLKTYLKIILYMGNMMNFGKKSDRTYGFKLETLKLLELIKDFSGTKNLMMFLYQFAYNNFNSCKNIENELTHVRKAVRYDCNSIEKSINEMYNEFMSIDQLCRRLIDDCMYIYKYIYSDQNIYCKYKI